MSIYKSNKSLLTIEQHHNEPKTFTSEKVINDYKIPRIAMISNKTNN